jgi:hypothetical protein
MKIFQEKVEIGEVANRKKSTRGTWLPRLVGINFIYINDHVDVEPIYLPLVNAEKIGAMLIVQISFHKPWKLIILTPWPPFIHIEDCDEKVVLQEVDQ